MIFDIYSYNLICW